MNFWHRKIISILIKFIEKDLTDISDENLTEEQLNGLMASLWDNTAFRKYIGERDRKIIWTIAGGVGMEPEPRDKYLMKLGQRVEILLLAHKAKACATKRDKEREEKKAEEALKTEPK